MFHGGSHLPYHPSPLPFYPGGYSYHHPNYYTYRNPPRQCTARRQCYDFTLILMVDGPFSFTGNATQFREHHRLAGINQQGMTAEGRNAARFLKETYGIDVTNLPDESFLAPFIHLPNGIKFNFVTVSPTLYTAANADQTQFYNIPTSVGWWNVDFNEEYVSTGTYRGTIPAGARVYYGSFVVDTCGGTGQENCNTVLRNRPGGSKVFMRFHTSNFVVGQMPGPFVKIDSVLEHEEWGVGRSRGVFFVDTDVGVTTGHEVLTFPESCSSQKEDRCYTGQSYTPYG